jgi:hypothetical protein
MKLKLTFCELLANHKQYIVVLFHISQQSTEPHGIFMNATATQQAAVSLSLFHTSEWPNKLHIQLHQTNTATAIAPWVKSGNPSQSTIPHRCHKSLALRISLCCTHTPIPTSHQPPGFSSSLHRSNSLFIAHISLQSPLSTPGLRHFAIWAYTLCFILPVSI